MQEEIEQKTITLAINSVKLTGKELKAAMTKLLEYGKSKALQKKDVIPKGKQSIKDLVKNSQGTTNIEVDEINISDFDHVARKYGIDYAVRKDTTGEKPKYLVFFKAKDTDVLTAAFKEYSQKAVKKEERRDSVLEKLNKAKNMVKDIPVKVKNRDIGER